MSQSSIQLILTNGTRFGYFFQLHLNYKPSLAELPGQLSRIISLYTVENYKINFKILADARR
jgi:hypothetical protein